MELFYFAQLAVDNNTYACTVTSRSDLQLECLDLGAISTHAVVNNAPQFDCMVFANSLDCQGGNTRSTPQAYGQVQTCHDDRLVGDGFISVHDISVLLGYILGTANSAPPSTVITGLKSRPPDFWVRFCQNYTLSEMKAEYHKPPINSTSPQVCYCDAYPDQDVCSTNRRRRLDDGGRAGAAGVTSRALVQRAMTNPNFQARFAMSPYLFPPLTAATAFQYVPPLLDDEYSMRICESDAGAWIYFQPNFIAQRLEIVLRNTYAYERDVIYEFVASSVRPACMHAPSENQDRIVVKYVRHHEYAQNVAIDMYARSTCAAILPIELQFGSHRMEQPTIALTQTPNERACAFDVHIWIPRSEFQILSRCTTPYFGVIHVADGGAGRTASSICPRTSDPPQSPAPPAPLPSPPPQMLPAPPALTAPQTSPPTPFQDALDGDDPAWWIWVVVGVSSVFCCGVVGVLVYFVVLDDERARRARFFTASLVRTRARVESSTQTSSTNPIVSRLDARKRQ